MRKTLVTLVLPLTAVVAVAAGTARLRIVNSGRIPLELDDGTVVPPGGASVVEVSAGEGGTLFGQEYPALPDGGLYTLRPSAAVSAPSANPAVPSPTPNLADAAEAVGRAYDTMDDFVAVPMEIYQGISPFLGASERDAIMKRVDARWPDKIWMPRKVSTWIGSAERVMKFWEKMGEAKKAGEIGGMVFLGLKDGKTPEQIFDSLIETGTLKSTDFGAEGEFAFLGGAIMAGLVSGESFVDSIDAAVDPEDLSFLGKIGYGWGYITSQTVVGLEKFLGRNDRARLEQLLLDNIRKAGYNEEAEKALRAWFAQDDAMRAITPFKLKDEWKTKARTEDMMCKNPEAEEAIGEMPESKNQASADEEKTSDINGAVAFVRKFFDVLKSIAQNALGKEEEEKAIDGLDRFFFPGCWEHSTDSDRNRYWNDKARWANARCNSEITGLLALGIAVWEGAVEINCFPGNDSDEQCFATHARQFLTSEEFSYPHLTVYARIVGRSEGVEERSYVFFRLARNGSGWAILMLRTSEMRDAAEIDWGESNLY